MRILYVGMKYDYGRPEQGFSFEHYNFFDALHRMGHDILYFDFMTLMQTHGRDAMNRRLQEVARAEKPDLLFCMLFGEELDRAAMRGISDRRDTVTLNWFCDDHCRFENFTCHWAPCFHWSVTTSEDAVPKYHRIGYESVIASQWACNHFLYRKLDVPLRHDVSFVGQPHGNRREMVEAIRAAGIPVLTRGRGWEEGRLNQGEMIEMFNASRINLNFSNSYAYAASAGLKARTAAGQWMRRLPMGETLLRGAKRLIDGPPKAATAASEPVSAVGTGIWQYEPQIKGRNFEVPGCGGLMLTGPALHLEDYYDIGGEVLTFQTSADLIGTLRRLLADEPARAAIARAGYERTVREHTYVHRFNDIFERLGLPTKPVDPQDAVDRPRTGNVEEIA